MTDQERRENLKTSQILHVKWLIEKVQELESLKDAFDDLDSDYIDLQQENRRYREALEEVVSRKMDTFLVHRDMNIHFIETATKALKLD